MPNVTPCQLPPESRLRDSLPRVDYVESFEVPSRSREQDLVTTYAATLGHLPKAFKHLLVLRSHLVKPLGIAGASYADLARPIDTGRSYAVGDKIGRWILFAKHRDELITGANDRHLDFRVSVFRDTQPRIVLSTAVMTHNAFGRASQPRPTARSRRHHRGLPPPNPNWPISPATAVSEK
jgi:hypothetical protein